MQRLLSSFRRTSFVKQDDLLNALQGNGINTGELFYLWIESLWPKLCKRSLIRIISSNYLWLASSSKNILRLMYQSNWSFNILPGQPPGIWILENFCSNSSLPGPKSCSNAPTLGKITRLLWRPLVFKHSTTNMQSFPLNSSKISTTHNMKSRLAIKFPTPMSGDQMPSLLGRKRHQMPGVCLGGGGGCWGFNLTGV